MTNYENIYHTIDYQSQVIYIKGGADHCSILSNFLIMPAQRRLGHLYTTRNAALSAMSAGLKL